jgi:hypothetical protein
MRLDLERLEITVSFLAILPVIPPHPCVPKKVERQKERGKPRGLRMIRRNVRSP